MKKRILFPLAAIALALTAMEAMAFVTLKIIGLTASKTASKPNVDPNDPFVDYDKADQIAVSIKYTLLQKRLMDFDPDMIFRVRPNSEGGLVDGYSSVNSLGFRGPEFNHDSDKAMRIMVVGDSNGFGWGLTDYEDTWTARLGAVLREKGVENKIFNISQPGYSTLQAKILFDKWLGKIKPDFVLFYLGWNDIWSTPGLTDEETIAMLQVNHNPITRVVSATNTYSLVKKALQPIQEARRLEFIKTAGYGITGMKTRVPIEHSIKNLESMISEAAGIGAKPVVVLLPYALMMNPELKAADDFNSAIFKKFHKAVHFVKLEPMRCGAPGNWKYFLDDGFHANPEGAGLIAKEMANGITGWSTVGQGFSLPSEWIFQAFAMPKEMGGEAEDDTSLSGKVRQIEDPDAPFGALVFGPYIRHDCPSARATFRLKTDKLTPGKLATIDVVSGLGNKIHASRTITGKEFGKADGWILFDLEFSTPEPLEKLETRVYFHGGASLYADVIRLQCLTNDSPASL